MVTHTHRDKCLSQLDMMMMAKKYLNKFPTTKLLINLKKCVRNYMGKLCSIELAQTNSYFQNDVSKFILQHSFTAMTE